jgi:hypothetical protein
MSNAPPLARKRVSSGRSPDLIAVAALVVVACTRPLDVEEDGNLIKRGTLAGVNCGDAWESVKTSHDPKLDVVERHFEPPPNQPHGQAVDVLGLERYVGTRGYSDGWYVHFGLDADQRIKRMDFSVTGTGDNQDRARGIEAVLSEHFYATTGAVPVDSVSDSYFRRDDPYPRVFMHVLKDEGRYHVVGGVRCPP